MSATQRTLAQIPPDAGHYKTFYNTVWIYPMADIERGMKATTAKFTFDGTNIVCPDMANLKELYYQIYYQTTLSCPAVSNPGYTVGVGTLLQNFGKALYWQLPGGQVIIKWRLVKQLTPQTTDYVPTPGSATDDTVGFTTVFLAEVNDRDLDMPFVIHQG
jgi:hypothetical protein